MSNEHAVRTAESATRGNENQTSKGNSTVLSIVLFIVLFGLFAAGLYTLSLFTVWTFVAGLSMCMVALFGTFDLVPRVLT